MTIVSTSSVNNSFLTREIFVSGSDSERSYVSCTGLTRCCGHRSLVTLASASTCRQFLGPFRILVEGINFVAAFLNFRYVILKVYVIFLQ
jgi:hypothetical protein